VGSAIDLMATVVRPLGHALTSLPIGPTDPRRAGFAFEMHYLIGNFVSWREPAWALLHERMLFLADKCTNDPDVVRAAGESAQSIATELAKHVPGELR
jgi:hypothetical protein